MFSTCTTIWPLITSLRSCGFRAESAVWVQPDNDLPRHIRLYMQNELHDTHSMMVLHASANICSLMIPALLLFSGLLVPRVPEVFLPLKQCIEILGANLQPRSAQAILDQCLQGIRQKVLMHWVVHTCQRSRIPCIGKTKDKLAIMQAIFATLCLYVACILVAKTMIYCAKLNHCSSHP